MAGKLSEHTMAMPFAQGLDTKTPGKLVDKLLALENGVLSKSPASDAAYGGFVSKRYGYVALSTLMYDINNNETDITDGEALMGFNNDTELLLFDASKYYTYSSTKDLWVERGKFTPVTIGYDKIIANDAEQSEIDMAVTDGIELHAWQDSRGGIRVSVIDSESNTILVNDYEIDSSGDMPKCAASGGNLFVVYRSAARIRYAKMSSSNPSVIGTPVTIVSDARTTDFMLDVDTGTGTFYIAYPDNAGNIKILKILSSGSHDATATIAETTVKSLTVITNNNNDDVWIGWHLAATGIRAACYNENLVQILAPTTIDSDAVNSAVNITATMVSDNRARFFYEMYDSTSAALNWIKTQAVSKDASLEIAAASAPIIRYNCGLGAKAFTENGIDYLTLSHNFTLQPSYILFGVSHSLENACNLANDLKALYNSHCADTSDHTTGADGTNLVNSVDAYDLASLIVLVDDLLAAYDAHDDDAELGAGWAFHAAQEAGDHTPASVVSPTDLDECMTRLNDLKLKYNGHDADATCHGVGSQYQTSVVMFTTNIDGKLISMLGGYYNTDKALPRYCEVGNTYQAVLPKVSRLLTESSFQFTVKGIVKASLDFSSDYVFNNCEINKNSLIVGGQLASYDGGTMVEHGFHVKPKITSLVDPDLVDAMLLANECKANYNAHCADAADHTAGADAVNTIAAPDATDYTTLVALVTELLVDYDLHDDDAELGAGWAFHAAQEATGHSPTSVVAPTTPDECITRLNDFLVKYNGHSNDSTCHGVGGKNLVTHGGASAVSGDMATGLYYYKAVWKWTDRQGNIHRSAPSVASSITLSGGRTTLTIATNPFTQKNNVVCEVYRTEVATGTVYYRVTSIASPTYNSTSASTISISDDDADADITGNNYIYVTGGIFENVAPPACKLATIYRNRAMLIDQNDILWPAKTTVVGEAVAFAEELQKNITPKGGEVTQFTEMDGNLIIFKRDNIYYRTGDIANNYGINSTFTNDVEVTTDIGCTQPKSMVFTPSGLIFMTAKGFYMLSRNLSVNYIGAMVEKYNNYNILSETLMEDVNQVRFLTDQSITLVYDYFYGEWGIFDNTSAVDAIKWNNNYVYLKSDGNVFKESSDTYQDGGKDIRLKARTGWLKLAQIGGYQRLYRLIVHGDFRADHKLKITCYYDFDESRQNVVYYDAATIMDTGTFGDGTYGDGTYGGTTDRVYEIEIKPKYPKCEAMSLEFEDLESEGEGYTLNSITIHAGIKKGIAKISPDKRAA
ncbi:MAG: hypothetical protein GY861_01045 [bacterium]|nr:hypothetical protein [bacterium]